MGLAGRGHGDPCLPGVPLTREVVLVHLGRGSSGEQARMATWREVLSAARIEHREVSLVGGSRFRVRSSNFGQVTRGVMVPETLMWSARDRAPSTGRHRRSDRRQRHAACRRWRTDRHRSAIRTRFRRPAQPELRAARGRSELALRRHVCSSCPSARGSGGFSGPCARPSDRSGSH